MRRGWILAFLGTWMLAPVAGADAQTESPEGAFPIRGGAVADPATGGSPRFGSGEAFGGFQPTDIGDSAGGVLAPSPPAALAPEPDAGPLRGAGQTFQFQNPAQTVAPAQFQSPATAKTPAEPKTTIVPAASAPPLQPPPASAVTPPEPQNLAQSLYRQSLTPPPTGAIAGSPLGLQAALARRSNPSRYAEFVKSYWQLSQALATYHDALQGAAELGQLPQPQVPLQQAMLQAAAAAAEAEVRAAHLRARSSQLDLSEQMTGESAPPLSQDMPLMTAYKSKFEAVFAGRTPPAGARRLHETFDARLAVVEARASAVVAQENAFAAVADAYAHGQLGVAEALREHASLQIARREFLASVYEYNAAIAEYAFLAAGPNRNAETIASMLVERK